MIKKKMGKGWWSQLEGVVVRVELGVCFLVYLSPLYLCFLFLFFFLFHTDMKVWKKESKINSKSYSVWFHSFTVKMMLDFATNSTKPNSMLPNRQILFPTPKVEAIWFLSKVRRCEIVNWDINYKIWYWF